MRERNWEHMWKKLVLGSFHICFFEGSLVSILKVIIKNWSIFFLIYWCWLIEALCKLIWLGMKGGKLKVSLMDKVTNLGSSFFLSKSWLVSGKVIGGNLWRGEGRVNVGFNFPPPSFKEFFFAKALQNMLKYFGINLILLKGKNKLLNWTQFVFKVNFVQFCNVCLK